MSQVEELTDEQKKLIKIYGRSAKGNFGVIDTIPVKHAYCIGAKHVGWASDHFMGMLSEEAIRDGEKHDIFCETCTTAFRRRDTNKILSYDEHETGLLVECLKKAENNNPEGKELHAYLKKCIKLKQFKKKNFKGFALLDGFSKKSK